MMQSITFAGHSALFVAAQNYAIAIDPWLTTNPACPANLKQPTKLDLIILTHGHSDHAADAANLAKHYGATVVATYELAMLMIREGVPEKHVQPMNKGGSLTVGPVKVTLTHAMHSSSYDIGKDTFYAGEPCGVVLTDAKRAIFHAGDTALFSDLKLIGERYHPEISFLPIGDRFTMGPEEAAHAAEFLQTKLAVPIHFETFPLLTGSAEQFEAACEKRKIQTRVLKPGEILTLK
jgi:L-ascorbate metabolism protein UlaG (beta-lactamase superfamily)